MKSTLDSPVHKEFGLQRFPAHGLLIQTVVGEGGSWGLQAQWALIQDSVVHCWGFSEATSRALKQRLPNHSMRPQGGLVKTQISEPHPPPPPASLGWSLRICLSNRFSEEVGAEATRTHSEDHCAIEQEFLAGIMQELNFRVVQLFVQSQTTNKRENKVYTQICLTQTPWPFYSHVCFHGWRGIPAKSKTELTRSGCRDLNKVNQNLSPDPFPFPQLT